MADDIGAKELGCYGHPTHITPRLDAIANGGIQFKTAYTGVCHLPAGQGDGERLSGRTKCQSLIVWKSLGKLFNCGDRRDGTRYINVTNSDRLEVKKEFEKILSRSPVPASAQRKRKKAA